MLLGNLSSLHLLGEHEGVGAGALRHEYDTLIEGAKVIIDGYVALNMTQP